MRVDLSDERGIVLGFLLKLIISFAVVGIVAADGAAILFAKLRADDAASAGATACVVRLRSDPNEEIAIRRAVEAANQKAPDVTVTAVIPLENGACTVTTAETASTLVVKNVGFLKDWGEVTASETAQSPS